MRAALVAPVSLLHAATRSKAAAVSMTTRAGFVERTSAVVCDRADLRTGIVHFGVGGFHRSHQQVYLDELLRSNFEAAKEWCYTGVGVLEWDAKMRDYLATNEWSYPVVSRVGGANTPEDQMKVHVQEVVSLRDMILSFEDPLKTIALLADSEVRVVSLTITEFGYRVPLNADDFKLIELALSGELMANGEGSGATATSYQKIDAAHEYNIDNGTSINIDSSETVAYRNATVFGLIMAALAVRFKTGRRPFTIMSCDNLPHNGEVAKKRVLAAAADIPDLMHAVTMSANQTFGYDFEPAEDEKAERKEEKKEQKAVAAFTRWLEEEVKYPSTMVDRITPATSPADIADLKRLAGIDDAWPVMCEPYKHWVIEDSFVDGARPPWEKAGALLVPDVRPHELMKVRLLNVTHSAMCYAGVLAGCVHVHEAFTHAVLRPFAKRLMADEIAASLRADPTMDAAILAGLEAYSELVLTRFENVAVKDTLDRIAMDGSEKFRVQGRAVVVEGLAGGRPMRGFALYVAAWAHFLKNAVEGGQVVRDASAEIVSAPWRTDGGGLQAFLDVEVFGVLAQHEGWRSAVTREFGDIADGGLEAALLSYIFAKDGANDAMSPRASLSVMRSGSSFSAAEAAAACGDAVALERNGEEGVAILEA